ncbi:hypothetical protein [Streptomyces sp. NPDC047999]|uniref:hypothetical protein n=1 Tax=Streptomyces sp. NPDC047999 TaxID=3365497 RepID=UPI00371C1F89
MQIDHVMQSLVHQDTRMHVYRKMVMTTTADPIQAKVKSWFQVIDSDDDGVVHWSDYKAYINRTLGVVRVDKNHPIAYKLTDAYLWLWREAQSRVHGDQIPGDASLSVAEHWNALNAQIEVRSLELSTAFDATASLYANTLLHSDHFKAVLQGWGITGVDAEAAFAQLDGDKSERISKRELFSALWDVFSSKNLNSPGSVFLGFYHA